MILAIDPGNEDSALLLLDDDFKPVEFGKWCNPNVKTEMRRLFQNHHPDIHVVIEMVASYGMAVGKEVFDTCVWIGRFYEVAGEGYTTLMPRIKVKQHLCHDSRAKDANIIQALKDRFGDKGTKKNPGWFYGFKDDVWQAYALGVTYADTMPF
jgi:hypothetical protein